jgi:hypothetical protein
LITNPIPNTVPEEILLDKLPGEEDEFYVIQRSNLVPPDSLLMGPHALMQMRTFLTKIHEEFAILYGAEGNLTFAMDIEYKLTIADQLIIKQARPWVSYIPFADDVFADLQPRELFLYPNPTEQTLNIQCKECALNRIVISDVIGNVVSDLRLDPLIESGTRLELAFLSAGVYIITVYSDLGNSTFSSKFLKL